RRVLPLLLASERGDVEIVPGVPHLLVASVIDEVSAEHVFAIADERVRAVPLVHAEVGVEAVGDAVPRHLPVHSCLHAVDVRLRRARGERKRGVARVQMGEVGYLVSQKRAAPAAMFRPTENAWLEEGAVNDQLTAALEQVEQTRLPVGSVELVLLLNGQPRHPPTLRSKRVTSMSQLLLFHQELPACGLPLLARYDRRRFHADKSPSRCMSLLAVIHFTLLVRCC